jgi:hypothetical protein
MIFHGPEVAAFVAQHGTRVDFGNGSAIGFGNGKIEAGFVYHDWNPEAGTLEMSGAALSPRWATKARALLIFDHAFRDYAVQLVHVQTSMDNAPVRRAFAALGGHEYEIPRLLGRDKSKLIITLTQESWVSFRRTLE